MGFKAGCYGAEQVLTLKCMSCISYFLWRNYCGEKTTKKNQISGLKKNTKRRKKGKQKTTRLDCLFAGSICLLLPEFCRLFVISRQKRQSVLLSSFCSVILSPRNNEMRTYMIQRSQYRIFRSGFLHIEGTGGC